MVLKKIKNNFQPACLTVAMSSIVFINFLSFAIAERHGNDGEPVTNLQRGFFNGYKGYHYHMLNYKKYKDGWWYPKEAFLNKDSYTQKEKKDLSLAMPQYLWAPPQLAQEDLEKHIVFCQKKYLSYDKNTNTYLTYSGKVKMCFSPYYTGEEQPPILAP